MVVKEGRRRKKGEGRKEDREEGGWRKEMKEERKKGRGSPNL
jgi:hypothetical protein